MQTAEIILVLAVSAWVGSGAAGAGPVRSTTPPDDDEATREVVFRLYTRVPADVAILVPGNESTVQNSAFNGTKQTKIIVHGFTDNAGWGSGSYLIKDALLQIDDINVILVDWSRFDTDNYVTDVVDRVPRIGQVLAKLVLTLGTSLELVHLIGHSLGAHIVGKAGSIVFGSAVGWVTGLDPAFPGYGTAPASHRLDASDARFVEAVHTDGGVIGLPQPVGRVDFYVNGGMHPQPQCVASALVGFCSHCMAYDVYATAILNGTAFVATKCDTYHDYELQACAGGEESYIGLGVNQTAAGTYYLDTDLQLLMTKTCYYGNTPADTDTPPTQSADVLQPLTVTDISD